MDGTTNEIEIEATPGVVFAVLVDPRTYPSWLVGAQTIRSVDDEWPKAGSAFRHRIGFGPAVIAGSTSIRRIEDDRLLELGAGMGPLGEALVRFTVEPSDGGSTVTVEEVPNRGVARAMWKVLRPITNAGLWGRNAVSLNSLKEVVDGVRA